MSRNVLAGLLGKSPSWVKQIEGGRLQMPKLPMVLRIAEVLRVRALSELTGDQSMAIALFTGPGHVRLPAVRAALDTFPLTTRREAPRRRTFKSVSSAHGLPGIPRRTIAMSSGLSCRSSSGTRSWRWRKPMRRASGEWRNGCCPRRTA